MTNPAQPGAMLLFHNGIFWCKHYSPHTTPESRWNTAKASSHIHTGLIKMSIKGTALTAAPWVHILMVLCSSSNMLILRTWSAFHCFQNRICPPGSTWHCKKHRDKDSIIMKLQSSCQRQLVLQGKLFEHSQRQLRSVALHNDCPTLYFSDQLFIKQKIKKQMYN